MDENFFADYQKFVFFPREQPMILEEFNPQDYATHFILTIALYDALLSNWGESIQFEIEAKTSLERVLDEFNRKQKGIYHLKILEMEPDQPYFVLALSSKAKIENSEANDCISTILETMISNPLYVGQSWYRLVGMKGRMKRKLFSFSFREYTRVNHTA